MPKALLFLVLIAALIALVHWRASARETAAKAANPPQGQMINVDGTQIHARVFGNGPDLVLIHGASGNMRDFTFSLVEKLREHYRVIVLDRPGLGWSGRPPGYGGAWKTAGESPRVQARLLRAAADQLDVENPLVLGHSFGGAVALAWALDNPDTAGLILLGGVSHPWPGKLDWTYPVNASALGGALFVPLLSAFVPDSYVETVVGTIFEPQSAPPGYVDHIAPALSLRRATLRANARQVNNLRGHVAEMAPDYPRLRLPIEVVHGDADTIVPLTVHSLPLSEQVQSAHLTVLPGIGHMPHHADEPAVIAAIDRAATRAGLR